MKKILSILLLVMVTGLSLNLVKTTKTEATVKSGGNTITRFYSKSKPNKKLFIMKGTSSTNAQTMYNSIRPATYSQAQDMANKWNGAKSWENLHITLYEDERCPFNPSYCSSQGKNYGSRVEGYGLIGNVGLEFSDWTEY